MTAEPIEQKPEADTAGTISSRLTMVVAIVVVLGWAVVTFREEGPTQALARRMRDVDYFGRRDSARKLGNAEAVDPKLAIPTLIAAKIDTDEEVRREAVNSLGQLGADAIRRGNLAHRDLATEAVLAALDDRDPRVREGALGSLALLFSTGEVASQSRPNPTPPGDRRRYVARVIAMLEDPDPGVRAGAGSALSFLPGDLDPALPALLKAVRLETALPNQARIARPSNRGVGPAVALRRARASKSSVPILVEALVATDPRVRILAASVLSRIGPDAADAIPRLTAMLTELPSVDERDDTARAAALALAAIAIKTPAQPKVLEALKAARIPGETLRALAIQEAIRTLEQKTPAVKITDDDMPRRR